MAEIYLAAQEGLSGFEKRVVIKRLLPHPARDPEVLAMFLDEARLGASLRHPHIVEVYDIGQDSDEYFIAMEEVRGHDLRELLDRLDGAPLPMPIAVTIAMAAARALHFAHEMRDGDGKPMGVVHRDVSPANILLARDGGVKLIDFGVAKWDAQQSRTRHGTLKGKLSYMSPEQCRAEPLDRRSDVFALGVLLYEITTGARPFEADSDFDVLSAIVHTDAEPPSRRRVGYPVELEHVVLRALRRPRDQRQATAAEFEAELRLLAQGQGWSTEPGPLAAYLGSLFPGDTGKSDEVPAVAAPAERTLTDTASVAVGASSGGAVPRPKRARWPLALAAGLVIAVGAAAAAVVAAGARPRVGQVVVLPAISPLAPALVPAAVPAPAPSVAAAPSAPVVPPPTAAPIPARKTKSPAPTSAKQKLWHPDSPVPP
jgi:serine/threonine-protein kinase